MQSISQHLMPTTAAAGVAATKTLGTTRSRAFDQTCAPGNVCGPITLRGTHFSRDFLLQRGKGKCAQRSLPGGRHRACRKLSPKEVHGNGDLPAWPRNGMTVSTCSWMARWERRSSVMGSTDEVDTQGGRSMGPPHVPHLRAYHSSGENLCTSGGNSSQYACF